MTKEEFVKIITKCQTGDKKAIGRIYDEYFGKMCATAFSVVRNADAAYDIASNVILKLLELRRGISDIENPVGYMFRMVHNEAVNYVAKKNREISVPEIWNVKSNNMPDMLWFDDILFVLTKKERELFILYIVWDMPLNKVAECLGITYGAAKLRYKNIKLKIKSIYKN